MSAARELAQQQFGRKRALVMRTHLDWCANTFGVAPCTASGEPCHQTYGACKDKANFTKTSKTRSYCNRSMDVPLGEPLRPYILINSYQPSPTELPIGGGLAVRSRITVAMADEVCSDVEDDPYFAQRAQPAGGTYGTRLKARNYNAAGRHVEVMDGYVTEPFDWNVFKTELYMIESIAGPDGSGNFTYTLSDLVRILDKNLFPKPTSGKLQADFKAIEWRGYALGGTDTTIMLGSDASPIDGYYIGFESYLTNNTGAGQRGVATGYDGASRTVTLAAPWLVTPDTTSVVEMSALSINVGSGNGVQYPDPAVTGKPQYVSIGKEVIRYDAVAGDTLSWTTSAYRAQAGSTREDHKLDDGVQVTYSPRGEAADNVLKTLFNEGGISDTHLNLSEARDQVAMLGNDALITADITVPTKISDLVNELLKDLQMQSWWDAVAQQQRFKLDFPELNLSVKAITSSEVMEGSLQFDELESLRITEAYLSYAPYDATQMQADRANYLVTEAVIEANAESELEYNAVVQKQRYSRWLSLGNAVHAHTITEREIFKFRNAPVKAKLKLDPRDEVQLGDLIDITHRKYVDASGQPKTLRLRVTKLVGNGNFDIEAVSTPWTGRECVIAPDGLDENDSANWIYGRICHDNGAMFDNTPGYTIV